jgi:hypothetical protein
MFAKSLISDVMAHQKQLLSFKDTGIIREKLKKIETVDGFAQIITGIRRCGKSTLLNQYIRTKPQEFHYLNFDENRLAGFSFDDFALLDDVIKDQGNHQLILFNEIQFIAGWERYVRSLLDSGKNVIITGSNASMLSVELGSKLTGRHIDTILYPFSYNEFLKYKKMEPSFESFYEFLKKGGFPEYLKNEDEVILQTLFNDILHRDIITKHGLRNILAIKQLALKLLGDFGKPFSFTALKNMLNVGSTNSITEYVSLLENCYLLFTLPRFSYSYKQQSINPKKVYVIDNGMINANSFQFAENNGRLLENVVFLSLREKYAEIFYFTDKHECDFVAIDRAKNQFLFQVCWELNNENRAREVAGLKEAMLYFKVKQGIIVTSNQSDVIKSAGMTIMVVPAWQWLLER